MREFRFSTAEEAEAAFYNAFEAGSLDDMMTVWAEDQPLVCIHPMGPRLTEAASIASSWRQIFSSPERLRIEPGEVLVSTSASLATHSLEEHIRLPNGRRGMVLATNVYRLTENGWRMVVHHGSPSVEPSAARPEDTGPQQVH